VCLVAFSEILTGVVRNVWGRIGAPQMGRTGPRNKKLLLFGNELSESGPLQTGGETC